MVPLLVGNEYKAGNEERLCFNGQFLWILHERSKNNWSRIYNAIAKECLHCTTGSKPVRRAQEGEPAPFFPQTHAAASPESKVPCWSAAWLTAVEHLPYGLLLTAPVASFLQHGRLTAMSTVVTSKSLHKGHQLGMAAVRCQPRAQCNDSRDERFDIPTAGSLRLSPLSRGCIDKTDELRFSESAQMRYAKKQLEAQRAKFTAKDTHDSAWLLWKQLLWMVRNGFRHRRAWQWWKIIQYAPSVCAWYGEEQNFCIFFPHFCKVQLL